MKKSIVAILVLICATSFAVDIVIHDVCLGYQPEAERLQYVGLENELVHNTTTHSLTVYDGVKVGGYPIGGGSGDVPLSADGTDLENGTALVDLYATLLASTPTAEDPLTIVLAPGTYKLSGGWTLSSDHINIRGKISNPVTRNLAYGCELTGFTPPAVISGGFIVEVTANGILVSDLTISNNMSFISGNSAEQTENVFVDLLVNGFSSFDNAGFGSTRSAGQYYRVAATGTYSMSGGLTGYASGCYSAEDGFFISSVTPATGTAKYCTGGISSFIASPPGGMDGFVSAYCVGGTGSFETEGGLAKYYHCWCTGTSADWGDS